jgi:hypothetical protein
MLKDIFFLFYLKSLLFNLSNDTKNIEFGCELAVLELIENERKVEVNQRKLKNHFFVLKTSNFYTISTYDISKDAEFYDLFNKNKKKNVKEN